MKILVTGAAGCIGFHLTLAILERDNEVCDNIYQDISSVFWFKLVAYLKRRSIFIIMEFAHDNLA